MKKTARPMTERQKGAAAMAAKIDRELRRAIEADGPMLIWLGDGDFPRDKCSFRGLSIGKKGHTLLSKWLGDLRVRQLPGSVSHAD